MNHLNDRAWPMLRRYANKSFSVSLVGGRLLLASLLLMDPVSLSRLAAETASSPVAHIQQVTYENNTVRVSLDKEAPFHVFS
ncbi:MAG TPA: hypothetical protein P5079_12075 [Elusimicrobiota bacterium]|nr:hypothetical protein [Elusimicrobiota bacterium]